MGRRTRKLDEIGAWSEIKLEIIRKYAAAYSTILAKQPRLQHIYVDAFCGAGIHISRETGQLVPGSPLVALGVKPRFHEYHFIDLSKTKVLALCEVLKDDPTVSVYLGDCNDILLKQILPRCRYDDFRRALWLLDPCGLDYRWSVVEAAGHECGVELFMNFPIMAINRDVGRRDPSTVTAGAKQRMEQFWGDGSWWDVMYSSDGTLFPELLRKVEGPRIVEAYCRRLKEVAGFLYVAQPLLMTNPANAPLYYIVFASHNQTGMNIADAIFRKYRAQDRK